MRDQNHSTRQGRSGRKRDFPQQCSSTNHRRGSGIIAHQIDSGIAQLIPDNDNPGGWTLLINGTPQSYVNMDDPTQLHFEYIRHLAAIIDTAAPPGEPLRVLHLGGGALTLPRYVAATRPGSPQRVVEWDAPLISLIRDILPLPRTATIKIRAEDGRHVVESTAKRKYDVVIVDVFDNARVPGRFATVEFARHISRILDHGGRYAINMADGPPLTYIRRQVSTLQSVFAHVALLAEPSILRGRRFGNIVLLAAPRHSTLTLDDLARVSAGDVFPARLLSGQSLHRFVNGAQPIDDDHISDSPEPPSGLFSTTHHARPAQFNDQASLPQAVRGSHV